jgi:hypothetical protein
MKALTGCLLERHLLHSSRRKEEKTEETGKLGHLYHELSTKKGKY